MPIIIALFIGFLVVENVNNNSNETNSEEPIKDKVTEVIEKKSDIFEVKVEPKKLEPVKEEVKPELVKELNSLEQETTNWFKLFLYAIGSILAVVIGRYLFTRQKNVSTLIGSESVTAKRELNAEDQTDTTEQEPAQEEVQTDTTEQEPAQEEVQTDTTEQELAQEEAQTDTTEQESVEDDDKNKK